MVQIGFHASHEQFAPSCLLRYVQLAEQSGFQAAMCSDHFHPWSERQGQSGFAWSWLAAAHDQWRHALLDESMVLDLETPSQFDAATQFVPAEELTKGLRISADVGQFIDWFQSDLELGFDAIYVNHVGRDLDTFIRVFSDEVLPKLSIGRNSQEPAAPANATETGSGTVCEKTIVVLSLRERKLRLAERDDHKLYHYPETAVDLSA